MQEKPAFNLEDVFEQRMVVLLETEPFSNKYMQIGFSDKHFKEVSDAISDGFKQVGNTESGHQIFNFAFVDQEPIELPEELHSIQPNLK